MFEHIPVILSILVTFSAGLPRRGRIYGGEEAAPGQFPFMVSINDPDPWCGGSIVAPSWILTTAQCVYYLSPLAEVYVGSSYNSLNGTAYRAVERVTHSDYVALGYRNDIGLLRIDGVLDYGDTIQPIGIGAPAAPDVTCTALGWGETATDAAPENLKYVNLTAIDWELCQTIVGDCFKGYSLETGQMCTLGAPGSRAYFGDNGGPLVCDGKLAGLVSLTTDFECPLGLPDIYTSAAVYAEWIQEQIRR